LGKKYGLMGLSLKGFIKMGKSVERVNLCGLMRKTLMRESLRIIA
jgi:hypothetical protein